MSYEQFKDAWVPEGTAGDYPVSVRVGRNVANDRQVITVLELDVPVGEFEAASAGLTRADAPQRLNQVIETTELAGVYEDVFDETSL